MEEIKYAPIPGGWKIGRIIGRGSIGRVYEIYREDPEGTGVTEREALKIISLPDGEEDIKRTLSGGIRREELPGYYRNLMQLFINEYECLDRLSDNEHIVRYRDHVTVDHEDGIGGDIYIRMELLTPLIDYTIENEPDEGDVLKLGMDIADALEACETAGLLHRDIKPDNIFVSDNGDYKLGDFGVARIIEETEMNLSLKGTLTYMAPEVYRGEEYGMASDIYSLGLVLYKYLNDGRLPFMPKYPAEAGLTDGEKALGRRARKEQPDPPAHGSDALKAVVLKACAPDPADRFRSAADLRRALDKAARGIQDRSMYSRRMRLSLRKALLLCAAAAAIVSASVWAAIPKKVTDITGLESQDIYIGDTLSPEYSVEPDRFSDETVTFESSDSSVLETDSSGRLTALAVGSADVTMTAREYTETAHINVVPKVTAIEGVEDSISVTEGETLQLEPVLKPDRFSGEEITYSAADEKIAAVTEHGLMTAVSPGISELKIAAGGCVRTVPVTVEAKPVPVYKASGSSSKSKSSKSKKSSGSGSGGGSGDYIDSSDDEYFD